MSNLTSGAPGAFDAFLGLIQTAAAAQNPPVQVFDSEVVQREPLSYVLLEGIENYRIDPAALGSYAFEEEFEIYGEASVYDGDTYDAKAVRDQTWALFQTVVQTTLVNYRGAAGGNPVLGANAPSSVMWCIPYGADYTAEPGQGGGWAGTLRFRYQVRTRITVP